MHSEQAYVNDFSDAEGWRARAERAEARVAQLEARFRYLRDAVLAVGDDELG